MAQITDTSAQLTETGGTPEWGYNVLDFGAVSDYNYNQGGTPGDPSSSDPTDGGTSSPDDPTQSAVQDTDYTDNTAAIQACLDAAATAGGVHVKIPAGSYAITNTLNVPPNVHVWGEGNNSTFIYQLDGTKDIFSFTTVGNFPVRGGLHHMRLQGPNYNAQPDMGVGRGVVVASLAQDGVSLAVGSPAYGAVIDYVYVRYVGGHGFHFVGVFNHRVDHCDSWENGYGGASGGTFKGHGFYFDGGTASDGTPGTGVPGTATDIRGSVASGGYTYETTSVYPGATGTYQTSINISDCYANACAGSGYLLKKVTYMNLVADAADSNLGGGYYAYDCTGINFLGCGAEEGEARTTGQLVGFRLGGSRYAGCSGITFMGCFAYSCVEYGFLFTPDSGTDAGVPWVSSVYVTMIGNVVNTPGVTYGYTAAERPEGAAKEAAFKYCVQANNGTLLLMENNTLNPPARGAATHGALPPVSTKFFLAGSGAQTTVVDPGRIGSHPLRAPYPYILLRQDSVQIVNETSPTLIPLLVLGAPTQTADMFQVAKNVYPADPIMAFQVNPNSGTTVFKNLHIPIYASVTAAKAAIPADQRTGSLVAIDGTAVGTPGEGLHLCLGIGANFYYLNNDGVA